MDKPSKRLRDLPSRKQELLARLLKQQPDTFNTFPVSSAQHRLWFLDQLEPDSTVYSVPIAVRLTGSLDVAALRTSLDELVRRHETLRTTIVVVDGEPMQAISRPRAIAVPLVSLAHLAPDEQAAQVERLIAQEVQQPFDLEQGPLMRARLFQIAPDEHVLLVLLHHTICDGWSLGVLVRELAACYAAALEQQPPSLPPLPIQYADYAVWQRQWLKSADAEQQLSYWREQLAEHPPLLELPTDFPRPAALSPRGASHTFQLSAALTKALHDRSRREGVTLFMTLLATFQILLHRYSGQADLLVGTPTAGRRRAELEGLIGCFVNTLVLRGDLSGNPSFRTLLQRVRATTLQAFAHQDLPFDRVVAEVQAERSMQAASLAQVFFVLQNAPLPPLELAGLTMRRLPVDPGTVQYDLTLNMEEIDGRLWGKFEYSTNLFSAETIARMAGHFQTLLAAGIDQPEQPISALPLLTPAERQHLLVECNRTQADWEPACLHQLVEAQAARTPDAIAVVYESQQLDYAELNSRANRLAHYLKRLNRGQSARVGVYLERSTDLIVALLAILKAGAAYVPIDPTYPAERIAFMLDDAQVPILVTEQRLSPTLPTTKALLVHIDADRADWMQASAENPATSVLPEQSAYVIYTSGSTGRPKGAVCHHAGIVNLLADCTRRQPILSGAACSWWTNISFDVSVYEIWSALIAGGALHIVPERVRLEGAAFIEWLHSREISSAYVPPFLIPDLAAWIDRAPSSLRRLIVGVEPIPEAVLSSIQARVPGLQIINGYGPTEATVCATIYDVQPETTSERYAPIGRPLQNMQIYLLDAALQPVPIGVPGEIYIGGVQLAHGYLNRPDLTAERFVPDPFGEPTSVRSGARLYRTGDRARYLPDGNLMFLGRSDQQVKVRGFRIELEEIEVVLAQHPSVRENVVLVREDRSGDKRLVAYVVENKEQENKETKEQSTAKFPSPTADAAEARRGVGKEPVVRAATEGLRSFLEKHLPNYMVPSAFVVLDALPLSPNGKIDRKALLRLDMPEQEAAQSFVAARTPVEQQLAALWSEVLERAPIGVHDDFFAIGGHSLIVTRLITRINAAFAVELPLRALFDAPTIAQLAARVLLAQQTSRQQLLPPIPSVERAQPLPLSFAQQRLWLLHQLSPADPSYNMPFALQLTGALDVSALHAGLNIIVARHEVLRTTFAVHDGEPVQVIAPDLTLALPLVDLTWLPEAERERQAAAMTQASTSQPFDLAQGPLIRAVLLRLESDSHHLLLTLHHSIADGWSIGVIVRELSAAYSAAHAGQPADLPALPVQYADFAVWQRQWLQDQLLDRQRAYWQQQMAGITALDLPTDFPRPATPSYQGAQLTRVLDPALTQALSRLSQQEHATLFMTLLAAVGVLLSRYSGQDDLVLGSPIAGRTQPATEPLIGFFVNMLPLRANLGGNPSFRDLLARVRETCLAAYAHQDLPFEQIVEAVLPQRDDRRSPLFQVVVALQSAPLPAMTLPDVTVQPLMLDTGTAKYELSFNLLERDNSLHVIVEYATDLFADTTIASMIDHLHTLLMGIVANPEQRLGELSGLPDHDQPIQMQPDALELRHEQTFVAPRTPIEQQLAALWSEVLEHAPIGIHDHFFAIGGHSLLVTRLITRINAAFAVELPLRTLFDAPTIAQLAARVLLAQQTSRQQLLPPIQPVERAQPLPLSFAQQRLWLLHQLSPADPSYNMPFALQLSGQLDVSALHASLNTIVARHEVLRTTFAVHDGEPVQVIAPSLVIPLAVEDLEPVQPDRRVAQANALALAEAQRPFDLAQGPLIRAVLLRLAPDTHHLLLTLHHSIADGWSTSVLIHELSAAYAAYHAGAAPALPLLPIQYADFAVWQRTWLQAEVLDQQLSYWKQQLAAPPILDLPTDFPRPATPTYQGAQLTRVLDPALTEQITALSQQEHATLFMTLLAAVGVLLSRYSGQDDLVLGSPIAGRTQPATEPLIGFFVNMLPLRANLGGNPSFRDLLARVRETCLAAYAHQDLPFEQIVEAVLPWRDARRSPLFQVAVVLQSAPLPTLELPALTVQPLMLDTGTAKYDLTFNMLPRPEGLHMIVEYATDLFADTTIASMIDHLHTLLMGIVANPEQRIADLSLISEEEQRLLEEWGNS